MAKTIKKHGKTALIIGLTLMLLAMYVAIPMGKAAQIENRKVTIGDSRPGQASVEYVFEGDFSTTSVQCIKVQFCINASGSCTTSTIDVSSADKGTSDNWGAPFTYATWDIASQDNDNKVVTATSSGEQGGDGAAFAIGSLTNPTATSTNFAWITTYTNSNCSTGEEDTGVVGFAIISGVTVQATVAESLTFTIASATSGECTGDSGSPTEVDSATTTVNFGELGTDAFKVACQKLTCNTNAAGGYNLTSQEDDQMTYGTTTIPDASCDGSCPEGTFDTWATANGNPGFGHSCEDIPGSNPCLSGYDFSGGINYTQFASIADAETATTTMSVASATSSSAYIHYKISVDSSQAAGTYSNTIVYIATPTY